MADEQGIQKAKAGDGAGGTKSVELASKTQSAATSAQTAVLTGIMDKANVPASKRESTSVLVAEFLKQVSGNEYFKGALTSWYGDQQDKTLETVYPNQPAMADRVRTVLSGDASNVAAFLVTRIAQLDELIQMQLDQVLHDEAFQKLEASWRGLHYLVSNTETGTQLKIRLLNATKEELDADIANAVEFDQSALFKQIYEEEYGTYGGNPFSVLIGDYYFGRNPTDVETLTGISGVAAAAHAPFIAAADPALFDWDQYTQMNTPRDLAKIFETADLIKWRSFRDSEDSRYVTLTLPRMMMRMPYDPKIKAVDGLNYAEDLTGYTSDSTTAADANPGDAESHGNYLWGNPSYALGARITDAFSKHRWCAAIRGAEGGGKVEGLPIYTFKTENGDITYKCPTETSITDRREKELNDLGFLSLVHCKGTDYATFFGAQTTNKPKRYDKSAANRNADISSKLPYILASSRFAHYIKVKMRDKVGSFLSRENVETYLNQWISQYVLLTDDAPQAVKAKFPLREARVDVTELPDKVGAYKAVVFLKPHFQLDELTVSLRLVAELPAPVK